MDAGGGAGRAAAVVVGDGAGGDGVWHARERTAMNAPAIRVRVIADFQDRGLTSLLALTGGTEHVFVIVLTPFVVRLEVSIWRPAGALPCQVPYSSGNKLSQPTRSYKGVNTYTRQGYHPDSFAWISPPFPVIQLRPTDINKISRNLGAWS